MFGPGHRVRKSRGLGAGGLGAGGRAGKGRERCMHTKSRAARGGQVKGGWTYRVVVSMQAEGKRTKGYGPNQH